MLNIVIFGSPGAGKGTQAINIAQKYNLVHISTGEIFRNAIKNCTELGKQVKEIIDRGELVPDELVVNIIIEAIDNRNNGKGFIFDGFPRTFEQARQFGQIMDNRHMPVNIVLHLNVDDNEIIKRLLNRAKLDGRSDDTAEIIENRLQVYRKETEPLLDFYKGRNKLYEMDGMGNIEEVCIRSYQIIDNYIIKKNNQ